MNSNSCKNNILKFIPCHSLISMCIQHGLVTCLLGTLAINSHAQSWNVSGNTATNQDFIGIINDKPLIFKTGLLALGGSFSERMRITESGFVGIGETMPIEMLDVNGAINLGNTSASNAGTIRWTGTHFQGRTTTGWVNLDNSTGVADNLGNHLASQNIALNSNWLSNNGQPKGIRINNNGFVGVGSASPLAQLHIQGNANATGLLLNHTSANDFGYAHLMEVNRDATKAFALIDKNGDEAFLLWGNGVVNTRKIYAEEIEVLVGAIGNTWPDYVFGNDYNLRPLGELEQFIQSNHHLPNIPSVEEIKDSSVNLLEMDAKLLEKIEETTLYVLQVFNENQQLKQRLSALEDQLRKLDQSTQTR